MVTLRGDRMWYFLYTHLKLAITRFLYFLGVTLIVFNAHVNYAMCAN